ncbi:MAG TPA: TetR/AcrR family transcriptional regulator [Bacillota bacterium]
MSKDETRQRIMTMARTKFFSLGYSSLTMDELAADLGLSKKTLYKNFASKNDLLKEVVEEFMGEQIVQVQQILNSTESTMEIMKRLVMFIGNLASQISHLRIQDLQKNAPEIWKEIAEVREKYIAANFKNILQDGIREGKFRSDVNPDLILMILISCINGIINPITLAQLPISIREAFEGIITVVFNGILTEGNRI